ncbi:MAG: hypothetical protein RIB71_15995 [Imperialibacter sp.]|uniref:hypothetical protein n=1 Tax=Imperialibacter sp. TaxID=2038411 RepID=UPI0032ED4A24
MHKIIFLPVALLFFSSIRAQEVKLSYFGETFTHYGVKGAYSLPLYSWEKTNRSEKTKNSALVFSPGLAIYRHTGNHIGVIVMPEVSYKTVNQKGSLFETGISPGLFRSFYEGQTFEVSEEGTLERKHLAGRAAFMPSLFVGFGKDLSVQKQIKLTWFCRFHVLKQIPYNKSSLTRIAFEAGISKPLTVRK